MLVNKKIDRLRQWGREKMGAEVKTDTNGEIKRLEQEIDLRSDGMERLKRSANVYIQSLSRREVGADKEKLLPIAYFGSAMANHGGDFESDSEFGQCLTLLGRSNERLARVQETYSANATSSWLESTERSLIQMKEYQEARKKLDQRRLAYDTATRTVERSKKEDFKLDEQLRIQRQKWEESSEDVYRRMLDIKEAESDSIVDLTNFLDAELAYFDKCRDILLQAKKDWPASHTLSNRSHSASPVNGLARQQTRSRGNSTTERLTRMAEYEQTEYQPRSHFSSQSTSNQNSPFQELPGFDFTQRPGTDRPQADQSTRNPAEHDAYTIRSRPHRAPTDPGTLAGARQNYATLSQISQNDSTDVSNGSTGVISTAPSHLSNWSTAAETGSQRAAPPPPPSRSKKPPPPPPLKRTAKSANEMPRS